MAWYHYESSLAHVVTYKNDGEASRDAERAARYGWTMQGAAATEGHTNVGRTTMKVFALGLPFLMTGASRTKGKLTITYARTPEWLARKQVQAARTAAPERVAVTPPAVRPYVAEKACPRCAETVKAAAKMCRYCQYEFGPDEAPPVASAAAYCVQCGAPLAAEARFCRECGSPASDHETSAATSAADAPLELAAPQASKPADDSTHTTTTLPRPGVVRVSGIAGFGIVLGYGAAATMFMAGLLTNLPEAALGFVSLFGLLALTDAWHLRSRVPLLSHRSQFVRLLTWLALAAACVYLLAAAINNGHG